MRKPFIIILVIAALIALAYVSQGSRFFAPGSSKYELPKEVGPQTTSPQTPPPQITSPTPQVPTKAVNLAVPFSPQAPYGDWSLPYQEACEEMSAFLVHAFFARIDVTPKLADQAVRDIGAWEQKTFGYYEHTTAAETAQILKQYFGYRQVDVLYDITINDIKDQLRAGRPVIVPLAGRLIGNPYYQQPGPVYHMIVVKGFTEDGYFITNDVGTKRGHNYLVSEKTLYSAIHDAPTGGDSWTTLSPERYILTGRKAIIVVYPN